MAQTSTLNTEPVRPPQGADISAIAGLRAVLRRSAGQTTFLFLGPDQQAIEVPRPVFEVLVKVVDAMVRGDAVSIVPVHAQLTTQQAAELLGVSRPTLVGLLEERKIPYERLATHRRVRLDDLLTFKEQRDAERQAVLRELTAEAERLGIEY